MASRRLILIGGSSGSGKSTTAKLLAQALGAGWLQIDTIWVALQEAFKDDERATWMLRVDLRSLSSEYSVEDLVEQQIVAGRFVCSVLPRVFWTDLQRHETVIADGAWLLPEFAATLSIDDVEVLAAFLHEEDQREVRTSLDSRRANRSPAPWHEHVACVKWTFGNYLAGEAQSMGRPVVAARPRETLLERLRAALE